MRFINLILVVLLAGCSTTGNFKVPKGANLYIYKRPVPVVINVDESISTDEVIVGSVTSKPFFWSASGRPPGGGIPYKIEKNGEMIKDGKLCSKFRVVSNILASSRSHLLAIRLSSRYHI